LLLGDARRLFAERGFVLADIRRVGSHIDKRCNVRVLTCLGDDRAPIAVSNQDTGAILFGEHALGRRNIIGKARERFLHDGDAITILHQNVVNGPPAGSVDPSAVHEHDILDRRGLSTGVHRDETKADTHDQ